MPGFLGRYEFQIDEKGRVSLPSAYRKAASGDTFVLLQWQSTHLDLLPPETWAGIQAKLLEFRRREAEAFLFSRQVTANAVEIELDKQGRIRIPERLREAAGLGSTVVFVGALDRVELWSPEGYQSQVEADSAGHARFAAQIFS